MIKDRIVSARKYKEKTQVKLAEDLGMSQSRISEYERGDRNPKSETLKRIASALGLGLHYYEGEAFFYDHSFSESMSDSEVAKLDTFNQLQLYGAEADASPESFSSPDEFEEAWIKKGGSPHIGRHADLARININEEKLNDDGIRRLADYSDDLVSSGKYDL